MKRRRNPSTIIEKTVGLPAGAISGASHFEINSNKEAIIEGCKSILQYDENIIRINTGKMVVSFEGRSLQIRCLTPDSLVVEGFITSIKFDT